MKGGEWECFGHRRSLSQNENHNRFGPRGELMVEKGTKQ